MIRRVAPAVAVVAAFYAVLVPVRLHEHGIWWFAHIGQRYAQQAHTSRAIDSVHSYESADGYDGQFYAFIAADPAHAADYLDGPGVRFSRIGYPITARALSLGSIRALPYALLFLNLAAVLIGTAAVAAWLAASGRSPLFAILFGLWPGMSFAVFRDLSEPLAYCLCALAVLVLDPIRKARVVASCALLAGAALTRETAVVFPLVLASRLSGRARILFLAGALLPMVVWRGVVRAWLGATVTQETGGWRVLVPFYGLRAWWPWDSIHWLMVLTLDLPFVLAAIGALVLLRRGVSAWPLVLLLLTVGLFVVFLPRIVAVDYGGAGRNSIPALLAALYCVPLVRSRAVLAVGAALLSPLWFIVVASAVGLPWLNYVSI